MYTYTVGLALPCCFSDLRLSYQLQITLATTCTSNNAVNHLPTLAKRPGIQLDQVDS